MRAILSRDGRGFGRASARRARAARSSQPCDGVPGDPDRPSDAGKIVVMTYPHIETRHQRRGPRARRVFLEGFVVRESPKSRQVAAPARRRVSQRHCIVGLAEIDTRALVRNIRDRAPCAPGLDGGDTRRSRRLARAPEMVGRSSPRPYVRGSTSGRRRGRGSVRRAGPPYTGGTPPPVPRRRARFRRDTTAAVSDVARLRVTACLERTAPIVLPRAGGCSSRTARRPAT